MNENRLNPGCPMLGWCPNCLIYFRLSEQCQHDQLTRSGEWRVENREWRGQDSKVLQISEEVLWSESDRAGVVRVRVRGKSSQTSIHATTDIPLGNDWPHECLFSICLFTSYRGKFYLWPGLCLSHFLSSVIGCEDHVTRVVRH